MRFLKTLTLNRRAIYDSRVALDTANTFTVADSNAMVIPKSSGSLTAVQTDGMIRYNTITKQFEGRQDGAWREFRFKESAQITQQLLGAGNDEEIFFGPLNPAPPATVQSGATWGGQNVLIIVENVIQLHDINYRITQNPSIGAEVYLPVTSVSALSGATTLYFNSALAATGASGDTSTVTLTFDARTAAPFSVGSTITVTDFVPSAYNGSYTVTACNTTSVSYASTTADTMTFAGQITSTDAVYPSINFNGSIITGSASLQSNTTITSFIVDADTSALVSVTFTSEPTTDVIASDVSLTITEPSGSTGTGYYVEFLTPVPNGKLVTALIGFDQ